VPLTEDQRIEIRREIGNAPSDTELDEIYDRQVANGVSDPLDALVLEVLEIRYAERLRNPDSFSVPGEYSESRNAESLKALAAQIEEHGGVTGSPVRIVPPPARYVR
jgi:hypothetical protein